MDKSILRLVVSCSVIFILTACATKEDVLYFQNAKNFETMVDTDTFKAKLKIGDVLNIYISTVDLNVTRAYNLTDGSGVDSGEGGRFVDYIIDPDGNIDYPVLGKIKVLGLTIEEAKQLFKKKFEEGQLLKDPVVIIRIKNYKISVLGDVRAPGTYAVSGERISILEAIANAGDLNITGRRENIMVIRDFNGTKTFTNVDITSKEVFNSPVYYLTQNDIVYVQPNTLAVSRASGDTRIGLFASIIGAAGTIILLFTRI